MNEIKERMRWMKDINEIRWWMICMDDKKDEWMKWVNEWSSLTNWIDENKWIKWKDQMNGWN